MKIATLFSGIGAPENALKRLGIPYELAYFCEFDKYAVKSYCAIHNEPESKNIGDITKVDIESLPKNLDLIVGGSPCQDFSIAGKRNGGEINSGTRSSLMWNFVEIIRETQPKAILWENVTGALTADNKANYDKFIAVLVAEGYKISAFTLNGKYFGVPQNRQRIFVLASKTHTIQAPKGYDCGIRLKDVLESKVDEKYYLSDKQINAIKTSNFNTSAERIQDRNGYTSTLCARDYKDPKCVEVKENALIELTQGQSQGCRVYDSNGISVTLAGEAGGGGAKTGLYAEPVTTRGEDIAGTIRSTIHKQGARNLIENIKNGNGYEGVIEPIIYDDYNQSIKADQTAMGTLTTNMGSKTERNGTKLIMPNYRIRRLTPLECFRLMGFSDSDYQKCVDVGISNCQLYKQAGNSIIVQVLMAIFGEYYGVPWREKVYGKWHKTGQSAFADLPIMEGIR
jgi:DNA (cytosine-5)-methyltransferase 1